MTTVTIVDEPTLGEQRRWGLDLLLHWEAQYEKAIDAFARRGFFVLVNDKQMQALDETSEAPSDAEITFLKFVPLVGG